MPGVDAAAPIAGKRNCCGFSDAPTPEILIATVRDRERKKLTWTQREKELQSNR